MENVTPAGKPMIPRNESQSTTKQATAPAAPIPPIWARRLISLALLFHLSGLIVGVFAAPPSSGLQQSLAAFFAPYFGLIDQGYSYRYYSPAPPPTPVVKAIVHFEGGKPDETARIPDRSHWPRLRYQRQLAIAATLASDVQEARQVTGNPSESQYAQAFARHIGRRYPGAKSVTLTLEQHMVPGLSEIYDKLTHDGGMVDLDDPSFFTVPERVGDFLCEGF